MYKLQTAKDAYQYTLRMNNTKSVIGYVLSHIQDLITKASEKGLCFIQIQITGITHDNVLDNLKIEEVYESVTDAFTDQGYEYQDMFDDEEQQYIQVNWIDVELDRANHGH